MKRTFKLGEQEGISIQLMDFAFILKHGLPRQKKLALFCLDLYNIEEINYENREDWLTFYHYGLPEYFSYVDWLIDEKELEGLSSKELEKLYNTKIEQFRGLWSYKYGYEQQKFLTRIKNLLQNDSDIVDKMISLFNISLNHKQVHILLTIGQYYVRKLEEEQEQLDFTEKPDLLEIYKLIKKR
ncbi:MAG: hypothetical protein PHD03_00850 [Bacilli bacterium]|nr:hypothetical protein [Bacilli bacterium]MDD4406807.1 hypothetical protein [Bacilli bacterium]